MLPQPVMTTIGGSPLHGANLGNELQPFLSGRGVARVVEVHQHGIPLRGLRVLEQCRGRRDQLEREVLARQQKTQRFEDIRLIVGDEQAGGGGRRS